MPDDQLDGRDDEWFAIERELRRAPRVDPAALARIDGEVRALAAARARAPLGRLREWLFRPYSFSVSPVGGLALAAAAALLVVATLRREWLAPRAAPVVVAERAPGGGAAPVARTASTGGAARGRDVQFVFVNADAARVSLVGDFNNWDPRATPLRQETGGVWSIVVPLAPGRHVYSFVVDGTEWVPDSAAARAPDSEFGGANSVVLVGDAT